MAWRLLGGALARAAAPAGCDSLLPCAVRVLLGSWQQPWQQQQLAAYRSGRRRQQQQQQQQHTQQERAQPQHARQRHQRPQQQQRDGGGGGGGAISPGHMTRLIMAAEAPRELLQLVVRHHATLNHVHVVAALNRAAELWRATATPDSVAAAAAPGARHMAEQAGDEQEQPATPPQEALVGRQQLERLMLQLAGPFTRALPHYGCREVGSALWAYARCGLAPPPELLAGAVRELCSWDKLARAEPQYLINVLWGAGQLGCLDAQLLSHAAAAAAAPATLGQLTGAQLAVLASSFGSAKAQAPLADARLGASVAGRALELLREQLELQEAQGAGLAGLSKPQRKAAARRLFSPGSLGTLVRAGVGLGWLQGAPGLLDAAARLARSQPFVYDFAPRAAANLLSGLATAGGCTEPEQQQQQQQQQHADGTAAAPPPLAPPALGEQWHAGLAVAAAALRRLDEADAVALSRLLWALAMLHSQQLARLSEAGSAAAGGTGLAAAGPAALQQHADAAARATDEASVVFDQLAAALCSQWAQAPSSLAASAVMAAWALAAAQQCGLATLPAAAGGAQQQPGAAAAGPAAPRQLLLQLAEGVRAAARGRPGEPPLPPRTVAELAAAFERLLRPLRTKATVLRAASIDAGPAAPALDAPPLSGAVDALVACAWQHAGTPGALEVRLVARLVAAFSRLQVAEAALYRDLLQHLSLEALRGCDSAALVSAVRAAAALATGLQPLLGADSLPSPAWQHLLEASAERWSALTTQQQQRLRPALQQLCRALPVEQVPADVAERVAAAAVGS